MKPIIYLSFAAGVIMLASCSSQQSVATRGNNDDGIYASSQPNAQQNNQQVQPASQSGQNNTQNSQSNTGNNGGQNNGYPSSYSNDSGKMANNNSNYYNPDDNNYDYTAQIRRYDNNWGDWGYYDDVYTNSYWYSGNPYQYGMSIYMGSPWWGPSYYGYAFEPSIYWGLGFGYNPYAFGWGYGNYWGGYYGRGYCGAYGNYYYNSYDRNYSQSNIYSGPRRSVASNLSRSPSLNGPAKTGPSYGLAGRSGQAGNFGEMYQNSVKEEAAKNPTRFTNSSNSHSSFAGNNTPIHVAYNGNGASHIANVPISSPSSVKTAMNSNNTVRFNGNPNLVNNANRTASSYSNTNNNRSSSINTRSNNYSRPGNSVMNNNGQRYNNSGNNNVNRGYSRPNNNQQRVNSGNYSRSNSGNSNNRSSYNSNRSSSNGGAHSASYGGGYRSSGSSGGGSHSSGGGGSHSSGGGGGHSGGGRR